MSAAQTPTGFVELRRGLVVYHGAADSDSGPGGRPVFTVHAYEIFDYLGDERWRVKVDGAIGDGIEFIRPTGFLEFCRPTIEDAADAAIERLEAAEREERTARGDLAAVRARLQVAREWRRAL